MNDFFLELVRSRLCILHHLDDLGKFFSFTRFECCDNFLCHDASPLFDFFMHCHLLKNRIVLLQFKTLSRIFLILRRNVTRGAGHACSLMLCTFQDDLDPVAFLSHFNRFFGLQI